MLTAGHMDRIDGVLLGQAIGDALGVPYELGSRPLEGSPRMLGGGLGDYAPGEFSDDTQMAVVIARALERASPRLKTPIRWPPSRAPWWNLAWAPPR